MWTGELVSAGFPLQTTRAVEWIIIHPVMTLIVYIGMKLTEMLSWRRVCVVSHRRLTRTFDIKDQTNALSLDAYQQVHYNPVIYSIT